MPNVPISGIGRVSLENPDHILEILGSPRQWAEQYLTNARDGSPFVANFVQEKFFDSNFRLNTIRVHRRAGKTYGLAILCLYYCMTMKRGEIIYLAPSQNQVQGFWDELERFIETHPFLKQAVIGGTKKPYMKQFDNGTILKGFTTGSSTNGKANNIRGLGGDVIFLDEVAMMSDADFDAITPILEGDHYRRFKPFVYATSTPQGSTGKFFEWCTKKGSSWHQIVVPITDNPMFTAEELAAIRKECNIRMWEQEYLVQFLDVGQTVFALSLIERAMRGQPYRVTPKAMPQVEVPGNPRVRRVWRTMGVDWDKFNADGSGPNFSIIEVDERPDIGRGIPTVIYRGSIPQGPQCFHEAVAEIIRLNDLMDPDLIYVDAGNGEMNCEALHKYGTEHPHSRLHKKTKRKHFGGNVIVPDPATQELVKKPFKPFMVNLLVKMFEEDQVIFAETDEEFKLQLSAYRVINQTTHTTTYSKVNEHIIDSVGLAMLAMWDIHKSEFKRLVPTGIHILPMPERVAANKMTPQQRNAVRGKDPLLLELAEKNGAADKSKPNRHKVTPTFAVELEPSGSDSQGKNGGLRGRGFFGSYGQMPDSGFRRQRF